jgi:hypothetical protein
MAPARPDPAVVFISVAVTSAIGVLYTCFARRVRLLLLRSHRRTRWLLHAIPFPFPQPLGIGGIRGFGILFLVIAMLVVWYALAARTAP